jgi:hypothetical protein
MFAQLESSASFLAHVPACWLVCKQKFDVETVAVVNFEKGVDTAAGCCWDFVELDGAEGLD